MTPRLTLTPGLRYEFYQPAKEDNNRADAFVRGHQSDQYPNAPLNLAFAGDQGRSHRVRQKRLDQLRSQTRSRL